MRSSRLGVLALIWAFSSVMGCGDDSDEPKVAQARFCPAPDRPCDIEEDACVESLLHLVACERSDKAPELPPIKSMTSEEFASVLRAEAEEKRAGPTAWDTILPKLKLLPSDKPTVDSAIEVASSSVLAFYDEKTDDITVISDAEIDSAGDRVYIMLHELTHYLQDRQTDLSQLFENSKKSLDERMSLLALVEGEATVNSTRALGRMMGWSPRELNWDAFFDMLDEGLGPDVTEAGSPLIAARQFLPYSVGGRYVARTWNALGRDAVEDLFEQRPQAFCDWMTPSSLHPEKTLQEPLDCAPPLAPPGFELYGLDSLGSVGAYALLAAAGVEDRSLAALLRNDAFALYIDESAADDPSKAPAIGVWRLRFSSSANAEKFATQIEPLDLAPVKFGEELSIRVSTSDSIAALSGDALEACPKLDELKPMKDESDVSNAVLRRIVHQPASR